MSKNLSAVAVQEFDSMVKQAYQGMGMLKPAVTVRNNVVGDTYIFLFGAASGSSSNSEQTPSSLAGWYESRADFIALTGPCPVLPDFAFGTWFTWWHSYTEAEAKSDIGRWEKDELPIDVWVSGLQRQ